MGIRSILRLSAKVSICIGLLLPISAEAKVIIWGEHENLHKIADLPDRATFRVQSPASFDAASGSFQDAVDGYFDLGIMHGEFTVFFLPLLVYDVRWIGYVNDTSYVDLKEWEINRYLSMTETETADPAEHVPFWNRYGGKIILIPIFLVGLIYLIRWSRKREPRKPGELPQ